MSSAVHGSAGGGVVEHSADVVVVGAGPGGSSAAYHLAAGGLHVVLLEKSAFPRDKVCGDGLTPRAVRSLVTMGVDTSAAAGWVRNRGLRIIAGGTRLELDWPDLADYPPYGLVRPRRDLDEVLARRAVAAGAHLYERSTATELLLDAAGRVAGVRVRVQGLDGVVRETRWHARVVLAADGASGRLGLSLGLARRVDRPMGVAVRRYYRSPRHRDDYLESWLELTEDDTVGVRRLLPGYGWIFGLGDGTANVGLGILNTTTAFGRTDYRNLLRRWLAGLDPDWGLTEQHATSPIRGGALPMGFNRGPHYRRGLLLVGDAGGAVNPFNGEGIAYAMETGELAAERVLQALARADARSRERVLESYPEALAARYGGYYTLGRWFVHLIGHPAVMRAATQRGLDHPVLMRFTLKLLANLTDARRGDAMDRIINALSRATPAA